MPTQISEYEIRSFTAPADNGLFITHDVYSRGTHHKKVVVIIQELPGIGQETLALADRFFANDYCVVLPHLFGPLGKKAPARNFAHICISREYHVFASKKSSPVVDWLRSLCQKLRDEYDVDGIATIGMCLTGSFAISLMADDAVLAGFASQPSLPFHSQKGLHINEEEIQKIKDKLDIVGPMQAGRFKRDWICREKKFKAIEETFNDDGQERIKFHRPAGRKHSILTIHYNDDPGSPTRTTLDEVMAYFDRVLE